MKQKTVIVVGASRGIGAEIARNFATKGYRVISVSRGSPVTGEWIQADLATPEGIQYLLEKLEGTPIDALLYMGGVWEKGAFTSEFDFKKSSDNETRHVLAVNLVAPIEISKGISENLNKTQNPRAIFIGALSGLDNNATPEVANTASKFGLRGAVQALRQAFRETKIGFTVINPGNIATPEVEADISEGRFQQQTPIPMRDLIATIEWILSVSVDTEIGDINLMQKNG